MPVALCTRVEVVRRWRNQGKVEVVGQWGRKGKVSATYTRGSHESSGDTKLPERNNIININVIRLIQYPGNLDQQFGPTVHCSRSPGNHDRLFVPLAHLSTLLLLLCLLRCLPNTCTPETHAVGQASQLHPCQLPLATQPSPTPH